LIDYGQAEAVAAADQANHKNGLPKDSHLVERKKSLGGTG